MVENVTKPEEKIMMRRLRHLLLLVLVSAELNEYHESCLGPLKIIIIYRIYENFKILYTKVVHTEVTKQPLENTKGYVFNKF